MRDLLFIHFPKLLALYFLFLPLLRELAREGPEIASKNKTKTESLEVSSCNRDPFDFESYLSDWFFSVFRIRIHRVRIKIQHFRLNNDPDPGF